MFCQGSRQQQQFFRILGRIRCSEMSSIKTSANICSNILHNQQSSSSLMRFREASYSALDKSLSKNPWREAGGAGRVTWQDGAQARSELRGSPRHRQGWPGRAGMLAKTPLLHQECVPGRAWAPRFASPCSKVPRVRRGPGIRLF